MMASSHHGFVRGAGLARESRLFEGRFGRIFRSLPVLDLDPGNQAVRDLVEEMAKPKADEKDPERIMAMPEPGGPSAETEVDGEEGEIPSGYTYLGQFIDHDLTFDPASSLERQNDPEALVDFRTPRFDLDSIYGRGPDDQPYMYEEPENGPVRKFHLGELIGGPTGHRDPGAVDHLRAPPNAKGNRRALIGDKRNDENTIVAQLHTAFLRFHNRMADECSDLDFEGVQREVRWHYQWVVLHDYLPRIVGWDMIYSILPHLKSGGSIFDDMPKLRHYDWKNEPFLPTEFSAAAFRFGHSMVRPVYRLSRNFELLGEPKIDDKNLCRRSRRVIFDFSDGQKGLNGFRPIPAKWAIEWDLFFGDLSVDANTPDRVQPAYKVDTSLVNPLAFLPEFRGSQPLSNLAYRNILRGFAMKLPSGEDVARAMGEVVLETEWLVIGKAEVDTKYKAGLRFDSFSLPDGTAPFKGATPLWLYILAEGAKNALTAGKPALGPVGGRIVAETMIGIMLGDKHSFLAQNPNWKPMSETFDMLAFINFATNDSAKRKATATAAQK